MLPSLLSIVCNVQYCTKLSHFLVTQSMVPYSKLHGKRNRRAAVLFKVQGSQSSMEEHRILPFFRKNFESLILHQSYGLFPTVIAVGVMVYAVYFRFPYVKIEPGGKKAGHFHNSKGVDESRFLFPGLHQSFNFYIIQHPQYTPGQMEKGQRTLPSSLQCLMLL